MKKDKNPSLYRAKTYSVLTLILIVVGSGVSYWTSGRIEYYTHALMHTENVLQRTDELYASILERETSIRGYVITHDEEFLTNYQQSNIDSEMLLVQLQELTMDNAQQQNNIEELRGLINLRIRTFESTIAYLETHGDLEGFLDPGRVSGALDAYRMTKEVILRINEIENKLFLERNQSLINNINALPFIVGLISLFSIIMGFITFFSIHKYNRAQQAANLEIKAFQEKLRDQIQLLDESNKELEQFAYVASHDLQEPLRKITAFSDLLNEQYQEQLVGDGKLYLNRITAAAVRMRNLITDLLEYSRAGRDKDEEIKEVKLKKVVKDILDDIEIAIKEKSATISFSKLPKVMGLETEYRQVFQNLISNALKFSKPNEAPVISISSEIAPAALVKKLPSLDPRVSYHLIKVSDNGIGFEPGYADRIFSIFQRLHGKNEYEGTGIGLSITRKIIDKRDGIIYAESSPGEGSTFHILLPAIPG
ncbi:CHASE3 domain-containing protein [Algoriphagus halophytocola]|uniref:histidine kinase n=1 Tax=Algoriphagus halophytocola TaxID=2991499 RepID=A0ABY6MH74_9BACT|nr:MULTISPECIES: sensor histidine kinase [unclassified Algoriphagus]UZD23132.1 CHASE3 domain-containing protein [Algoriphagus sp. TR-M5]WBL44424.1 CHASE3 domain-containing protein [Algoriphagus sp. TR-M9]